MGILISPIKRIERVRFNLLKRGQAAKDVVAVSCPAGRSYGAMYFLTKHGGVYTNDSIGRNIALSGAVQAHVKALVDLGLVSKEEERAHADRIALSRRRSDHAGVVHSLERAAEKLGLKITRRQRSALVKLGRVLIADEKALNARCVELNKKYAALPPKA